MTNENKTIVFRNQNDEIHCETGPAIIYPSHNKEYLIHGKNHREDGPAIIYATMRSYSWYIADARIV